MRGIAAGAMLSLALPCFARALPAQRSPASLPSPAESVLAARFATLDGEARTLRGALRSRFDSVERTRQWVTMNAGGGTLRASAGIERLAAAASEDAWARVASRGGAPLVELRAPMVLIVREDSARWETLRPRRSVSVRFGTGDERDLRRSGDVLGWPATSARLADVIVRQQEQLVAEAAAEPLRSWRRQQRLPLAPAGAGEWRNVARGRALVSSRSLRACGDGDASACAAALGLGAGATAEVWYAPEDRRALLERVLPARRDSAVLRARTACVERDDRAACARALAAFAPGEIPPPLDGSARRLLLDVALELGGEGALARLLAPGGSIEQRIADAAGMPLDSVVLAWRSRLDAAAPAPARVAPVVAMASLGWSTILVLLAARRRRVG